MGIRGEIFSQKVILPNRTYFFNVKENRTGDLYINIVESKNRDSGGFDRQSVILFAEDLQEFLKGFEESLKVMEKATREKKRGAGAESHREKDGDRGEGRKPRARSGDSYSDRSEGRKPRARSGDGKVRGKRVVVKKYDK